MQLRVRDLPRLLRAPVGRNRLRMGMLQSIYPLLRLRASLHRRFVVPGVRLVAVVGSYGKTTTARAVAAALGLPENPKIEYNSTIGLTGNLNRVRRGNRHAVLEVGISSPGQMAGYAKLVRPDVAVVTSVGSEHNRSLGTLEETRNEKADMVRALPDEGVAVLNADDENVLWMAGQTRARVVTFGRRDDADICVVEGVVDWPHGMRLGVRMGGAEWQVRSPLLGWHSVAALLAAAAVASAEGFQGEQIVSALGAVAPTPGRMQIAALPGGAWLVRDEFKSSLETVQRALDTLAQIPAPRRIAVLGEVSEPPGSQGEIYRALGERLAGSVDAAVFVGGNFQRWARGAVAGGMAREDLVDAGRDLDRAVAAVRERLEPGTVVLVKGRDTQRLDRVSLALLGRHVGCSVLSCSLRTARCEGCSALATGWGEGLEAL